MSRLSLVPVEQLTGTLRATADALIRRGESPAPAQVLGHRPDLFESYFAFYVPLRDKGIVERRLKELVRLRIAQLNDCAT